MASSENLASFEPFLFRPAFPDSWISEAYARDTETLTKALQTTFSNNTYSDSININPLLNLITSDSAAATATASTPSASTVSGSDPDTPVPRSKRHPGATGKVSKRKSRASKRSQTTFITADPANFRQMVQQVTGVRFGNSHLPVPPVLKPEPQRPGNRLYGVGGCLPTLDTSAFLLDHQQQQQQVVACSTTGSGSIVGSGSFPQPVLADGGPGSGLDFDCFSSSFPTLESYSWKIM